MNVVISKEILGTEKHLLHDGKRFTWSSSHDEDGWKLGFKNELKDLRMLADGSNVSLSLFDSTPSGKAAKFIFGESKIPWMKVLPDDVFRKQLTVILDQLWMLLRDESNGYYKNQFLINREIIMNLCRPIIDTALLKKIISNETESRVHDLKKFLPKEGDISPRTVYNQLGSVTGRLTVIDGPNILTLKRENRKILKSRFDSGLIIQLDISSLEPRIALSMAGKDSPKDIYKFIGDTVLENQLTRDQVKVAVLTCIYGGSVWSLSQRLPKTLDAKYVLESIVKYFKIEDLRKYLQDDLKAVGHIKNLYGRQIKETDAMINHFLQSSGVDVSFNVFSLIIEKFNSLEIEFIPLYVIHDAIVLDIPRSSYDKIKESTQDGFLISELNCKFPIKIEVIRE